MSAAAMAKSRVSSRRSASFFSVRSAFSSPSPPDWPTSLASYPASLTAEIRIAASTLPWIVARSVARLTTASVTPGIAFRARSMRPTQDAQVIPSIDSSVEPVDPEVISGTE
ncbi:hypothetical protein D9M68_862140 [compost metagenome]